MRKSDYLAHWRSKHDPEKPESDKVEHRCEDCDYRTTHKSHMNKHLKKGCPVKRKLEEKEKKEKEMKESHRDAQREYKQRKAQEARKKMAHIGLMELRAAEQQKRDAKICPTVYDDV